MDNDDDLVLYDPIKNKIIEGKFNGSIISIVSSTKTLQKDDMEEERINLIIFSDNIEISKNKISIVSGLMVGFEENFNDIVAFSKKSDFTWFDLESSPLKYSILIPSEIMELFDEGQFSDAFPFTINLLHTAGLYLNDSNFKIDHLDFFKGEILKNPVGLVFNGFCIADRIVIDHRGDPVFYDCLIIGRDQEDNLKISYEPLLNVKMDDNAVKFIIILGIEELKL